MWFFFYLIGILIVLSGVGAYKLINNIIIDANLTSISALLAYFFFAVLDTYEVKVNKDAIKN